MSQEIDVDADPFLKLLTEALRAGPGSPEWHQAVGRLREAGPAGAAGPQADEYRMLIAAREHLESGREYRSVQAGAGFTRKVLQGIEREGQGDKPRALPLATLIAIASALAIVAVLVVVGFLMYPRTPVEVPKGTVDDLVHARAELMNETAVARFGAGSTGFPEGWRHIGSLPLDPVKGLRPAANAPATAPAAAPVGGGIVAANPIGPDEPFAAETLLRLGKPSDDTFFEFFVSTDPNFSPDRATSTSDIVWLLQGGRQKVLLSGREQSSAPRPEPDKEPKESKESKESGDGAASTVPVRILVNHDSAVVECNGQRLWAGPHGLPAAPRSIGIRFLRTGPRAHAPVEVVEVRVMKK